jgi:phenylacetate-CoA ligase
MYKSLVKYVLAPALDSYRGGQTMKHLNELEKTQWWTRDRILALQDERLRKLIGHAYDNVPYYRRIFEQRGLKPEDIVTSGDLMKLPILTRPLVRNNFNDLMARGFPSKKLVLCRTAGSIGEPLRFYGTRDDCCGRGIAAELRAYGWAGYEVGDRCALLCEPPVYESGMGRVSRVVKHFLQRIELFNPLDISEDKLSVFARKLEGFQDGFIKGYPTAIYLLARFMKKEGKRRLRPKAIISVGEELYDFQRELFEEVFDCETYSYYGSNEVDAIGAECSAHSGYHTAAENVIVEIVDDQDRLVPPGREGRLLITNLHNYGMPFIRYEIGDIGAVSDKNCPCGRGLPLLSALNGRTADVILTRGGKFIPGIALPFSICASLGVEQFQIVQDTYEKVVIKVVLDKRYSRNRLNEITEKISRRFGSALGEGMDVAVECVDRIQPTASGKRRLVISNVPGRF